MKPMTNFRGKDLRKSRSEWHDVRINRNTRMEAEEEKGEIAFEMEKTAKAT